MAAEARGRPEVQIVYRCALFAIAHVRGRAEVGWHLRYLVRLMVRTISGVSGATVVLRPEVAKSQ